VSACAEKCCGCVFFPLLHGGLRRLLPRCSVHRLVPFSLPVPEPSVGDKTYPKHPCGGGPREAIREYSWRIQKLPAKRIFTYSLPGSPWRGAVFSCLRGKLLRHTVSREVSRNLVPNNPSCEYSHIGSRGPPPPPMCGYGQVARCITF